MLRFLTLLSLLHPATAMAACPTRADLVEGIVLVQNDPFFRRADLRFTARGLTERRTDIAGGTPTQSTIVYAHGLAPILNQSRLGGIHVTYHGDVDRFDRLDELGEVTLTGDAFDGSAERRSIAQRSTYLGSGTYHLSECRYDSWRVRHELFGFSEMPIVLELEYAPELNTVLSARTVSENDAGKPLFAYSWIGTRTDVQR